MLFESEGLSIEHSDTVRIEQHLESWMGLTRTPPETEKAIRGRMEAELSGGPKTGFAPYRKEDEICFEQRWVLTEENPRNSDKKRDPVTLLPDPKSD